MLNLTRVRNIVETACQKKSHLIHRRRGRGLDLVTMIFFSDQSGECSETIGGERRPEGKKWLAIAQVQLLFCGFDRSLIWAELKEYLLGCLVE